MNKDVIYIDVDDDVTAIIGKIKEAKEKVVALVPPKRAGALQSAVNLRLLERMAKTDKKKLVLVTHNPALMALAANANIPVAKNLQSKPELAEVPALVVDDGDDIIDGADLPVGDHAATAKGAAAGAAVAKGTRSDAVAATDLEIDGAAATGASSAEKSGKKAKKDGSKKIPNFDSFRKKLIFGITGGVALIALFIWMFVFAPAATVVITASTEPQSVSSVVELSETEATSYEEGVLKTIVQEEEVDEEVEFTPTGEKNVGENATGTVSFSTNNANTVFDGETIPAGTQLRSGSGLVFVTDEAVSIGPGNFRDARVTVTAAEGGDEYNGATGSLSGAPATINARFIDATSGGTSEVIKVVTEGDVERARGELIGKSTDDQKASLESSFDEGTIVIDSSFTVDRGSVASSPAVGEEVTGNTATLTVPTTYSLQGVPKEEVDQYLMASLEERIDAAMQKVYSSGADDATLGNFNTNNDVQYATLNATGSVGPEIDETAVKEQVKGKRYGEVQQTLKAINGVQDADTQFSYFWVRTVPNNIDKITIEFKVEDE